MPQIGFGVFRVPGDETAPAVLSAIEVGYRGIDTASLYGNETAVGTAVARCGVPREQLFITTKLWNDDQGYESAFGAFDASLGRLGLDYVDLYLIHWPVPAKSAYLETWKAFEEIYASGRARAIGVSNFQPWHLQPLLDRYRIVPAVNQVELHPRFQQEQVRAFDRAHGIVTEAWSPLAQGDILADPVITALSRRYGKTPAQIVLRWHIELGNVVIPKSVTPSRIKENMALGLIGHPDLLFLDEPTTGFDPNARRDAWEVVRDLRDAGTTIMLTTHYMDEAQALADRLAVISDGQIVAEGTPATIGGRDAARARIHFTLPPGCTAADLPVDAMPAGGLVTVRTAEPTQTLHQLTGWALRQGTVLGQLTVDRPSLEDIYLRLTDHGAPERRPDNTD
jgi:2,5-diketo-D-gluconate reductase A